MSNYMKIVIAAIVSTIVACAIFALAIIAVTHNAQEQAMQQAQEEQRAAEEQAANEAKAEVQKTFPTGWLLSDDQGIPAFVPVQLFYLPDYDIVVHEDGIPSNATAHTLPEDATKATVLYNGQSYQIDPSNLLVNMPDILSDAVYDIQYAYAAPSRSGGNDIPNLTGQALDGYLPKSMNAYLTQEQYAVPCAYGTAMKLVKASGTLQQNHGYHIVFWDIYRPYRASRQISDAFIQAYNSNAAIQASADNWGVSWYAADGVSGHNYATDVDVTVVDANGNIIPMPSAFDAFDETAHLTAFPMNSGDITVDSYRSEIKSNQACIALHDAMKQAGFSELASEWWHFSDDETENVVSSKLGNQGMDFVATL